MSTAFQWRHKVLASLRTRTDIATILSGVVEADETFFTSHTKAVISRTRKILPLVVRSSRKHGNEEHKRGRSKEQVPVLVLRVSLVMPSMKKEEIARQMLPVLSQDTALCTAFRGFKPVTKSVGIKHIALNQNK